MCVHVSVCFKTYCDLYVYDGVCVHMGPSISVISAGGVCCRYMQMGVCLKRNCMQAYIQ